MPVIKFIPPISFGLLVVALFISIALEIMFVKKFAGKVGIKKESTWIKAVFISTSITAIVVLVIAHIVDEFISNKLFKFSYLPFSNIPSARSFISFLAYISIPIILRVLTYSLASPVWKKIPVTKKFLFCSGSSGLVSLLAIWLAFGITQPIEMIHNKILKIQLAKAKTECLMKKGTWDNGVYGNDIGYCIFDSEEKCTARDGSWQRRHMAQLLVCLIKYKDAGKICTNGSDCEGGECSDKGKHLSKNGIFYGECVTDNDPYSPCYDNLIEKGQKQLRPCAKE